MDLFLVLILGIQQHFSKRVAQPSPTIIVNK
jgi:hypothetical protein